MSMGVPDGFDWNPTKPSRAVIASDGGTGCVLWRVGAHLDAEMDGAGFHCLGDLGLDDAPNGLSVWEGYYVARPGMSGDPWDETMQPEGAFRKLTSEEWAALQREVCPWDIREWLVASPPLDGTEEP